MTAAPPAPSSSAKQCMHCWHASGAGLLEVCCHCGAAQLIFMQATPGHGPYQP